MIEKLDIMGYTKIELGDRINEIIEELYNVKMENRKDILELINKIDKLTLISEKIPNVDVNSQENEDSHRSKKSFSVVKGEIPDIFEDRNRLEGALCNSGYVEKLEEAIAEVQTFINKIRNQTLDEVEDVIGEELYNLFANKEFPYVKVNAHTRQQIMNLCNSLLSSKIAKMREGKK